MSVWIPRYTVRHQGAHVIHASECITELLIDQVESLPRRLVRTDTDGGYRVGSVGWVGAAVVGITRHVLENVGVAREGTVRTACCMWALGLQARVAGQGATRGASCVSPGSRQRGPCRAA